MKTKKMPSKNKFATNKGCVKRKNETKLSCIKIKDFIKHLNKCNPESYVCVSDTDVKQDYIASTQIEFGFTIVESEYYDRPNDIDPLPVVFIYPAIFNEMIKAKNKPK